MAKVTPQEKPIDQYGYTHEIGKDPIQTEILKDAKAATDEANRNAQQQRIAAEQAEQARIQALVEKRAENEEKMKKLMGG